MKVSFSVICLTYNSDIEKTLATLNSVINQKYCDFEVIVADDASQNNNFDRIENYFVSKGFLNYKLKANENNNGIISNFLSAIKLAEGKYIKYISPGDYLYDEITLRKCFDFMQEHSAEYAFGKALWYREVNNNLEISVKQTPVFTNLYDSGNVNYDYDTVLKYNLLYQDRVLGAAIIATRTVLEKYLGEIAGEIKYIEDNTIIPLLTLDKKRIWYFEEYILWYECDSGISTNPNRGFKEKLNVDYLKCYKLLRDKYSYNTYIFLAYLKQRCVVKKNKLLTSVIKRVVDIFYGGIKYKRIRRKESNKFLTAFNVNSYYRWREFK